MENIIWNSFLAGIATLLGSIIVIIIGTPKEKLLSFMLGLASGVMLTVTIIDLLPSAFFRSSFVIASSGFLLGIIILTLLDTLITHLPSIYSISEKTEGHFRKMGYLITIGIALHDLPEGIAIAVGYGAAPKLGLLIALAIGLHNIPEGMATAAPLKMSGMKNRNILLIALLISLVTPIGAFLGLILISCSSSLIGLLLALAGGAMIFIVNKELWPESIKYSKLSAYLGAFCGIFVIMTSSLLI